MDEIEQKHRNELMQVRAALYENQKREHELVMILSTLSAVRSAQQTPEATPEQ